MNRFITSLIAILSIANIQAQYSEEVPKLVINITVDQLRGDYLQYFSATFGERGFKRLINEGLVYYHVQYDFPQLSQSSAVATLSTGTNPCYHGIVADKRYNFEQKREQSIIYDAAYMGNYTSDNLSPMALLSTTVGDELKIASEGRSDVFAIAPDASEAVLAAGRYANAAFWIEDYNGKWATTTYYKNVPWYVDKYNTNEGIGNNSSDIAWVPTMMHQYKAFPYSKNATPFKYSFVKNDKERYLKIKTSPFVNSEVTNLAGRFMEYADFGKRTNPDMLSITYYAGNYREVMNDDFSYEIQDTYYNLDKEIEKLLNLVDKHVGMKNALIVLTSTGYFDSKSKPQEPFKPAGEFFPNRCTALLNVYLMAIYGQGNWVDGYYNNQIYLNKKLIEDNKVDFNEIIKKSAEFVSLFSGVQNVTTSGQMLFENKSEGSADFQKGIHKKISGNLYLELQPGWVSIDEKTPDNSKYVRNNAIISPLFFLGMNIHKGEVFREVKATAIAPTVTHVLRIRPPNACKELPLQEFLKK